MALTYTWSVTGLKKRDQVNADGDTLAGAVVQTYWKVVGTDSNGDQGEFAGATPFTATQVPAGEFTSFESLEEEDVLGWIQDVVNNDPPYKEHIDERILNQIDLEQEEEVHEMPWGGEPVTPVPPAPLEPAPEDGGE